MNNRIKDKGVYTTKCPACTRIIVMHVLSDGVISPKKCSDCELEFEGLDRGAQRNTFIVAPRAKNPTAAVYQEVEEKSVEVKEQRGSTKVNKVNTKDDSKKGDGKAKRESFRIWE